MPGPTASWLASSGPADGSSSSAMATFSAFWPRWLGLPPGEARHFWLGTAALCILGYEHTLDEPAILLWNDDRHATL